MKTKPMITLDAAKKIVCQAIDDSTNWLDANDWPTFLRWLKAWSEVELLKVELPEARRERHGKTI